MKVFEKIKILKHHFVWKSKVKVKFLQWLSLLIFIIFMKKKLFSHRNQNKNMIYDIVFKLKSIWKNHWIRVVCNLSYSFSGLREWFMQQNSEFSWENVIFIWKLSRDETRMSQQVSIREARSNSCTHILKGDMLKIW